MASQCSPPAAAHDAAPHGAPSDVASSDRAPGARAWLEVDLDALVANARRLRAAAGVPLLPMVKADAYGLGADAVAPALAALGRAAVWGLGVAGVDEGAALRARGLTLPVLVFTPLVGDDLDRAAAAGLTPSLHRADDVRRWAALGGGSWHLAVDTGMSRAGVRWDAVDGALVEAARACPPEGAYTHFHSAERGDGSAAAQEGRFRAAIARLAAPPRVLHVANSPALVGGRGAGWDLARPGLYLYGAAGADEDDDAAGGPAPAAARVRPPAAVAHLRARVVDLRDLQPGESVSYGATWRAPAARRVATVAAGYGDGYRRALSGRGVALVGGREVPVLGRVTMDMTMLDVTGVPCALGDVATLLGRDGDRALTVDAVAARGGLSPYELLVGLRLRAPRVYTGAVA